MVNIIDILRRLLSILERKEKRKLLFIQIALIMMGAVELVGIGIIFPFSALVLDPSKITDYPSLIWLGNCLGVTELKSMVIVLGVLCMFVFIASNIFIVFVSRHLMYFSQHLGHGLASSLYAKYIKQPYIYHVNHNSADLFSNIVQETNRVTFHIVEPLLRLNQRLVLILSITIFMLMLYPEVVLVAVLSLCTLYCIAFLYVRKRVSENGRILSSENIERMRLLKEGFDGIKIIKLSGQEDAFAIRFRSASEKMGKAVASSTFMGLLPRYALEVVVFSAGIIFLLMKFVADEDTKVLIPHFAVFMMASIRLLPSFQQVFAAFSQIKNSENAFWVVANDLEDNSLDDGRATTLSSTVTETFDVVLDNISFRYPGYDREAISGVSLTVPSGSCVAFVGGSGSGKSTLMNLISGLLEKTSGSISIGGDVCAKDQLKNWRNKIGYVTQDIFLSDRSIAENIAFGIDPCDIDMSWVKRCAHRANLDAFVVGLENGYDARVGENGIQLSGGQRQRIAIARALYNDPDVLIFDEGTSSLDGIIEEKIINSLKRMRGSKTIIMVAHRITTVKDCDRIYIIEDGKVVNSGSYGHLIHCDSVFKKMAGQ